MVMYLRALGTCFGLLLFGLAAFTPQAAVADGDMHLRLVDPLDRPQDLYCLDILGTPNSLILDVPIFAHNCKRGLTVDSALIHEPDGRIRFTGPDLCLTAYGVNGTVLAGIPLLVRPCGDTTLFFNTSKLQTFVHREDGRVELRNSGLCLAVGETSSVTHSPADVWRVLKMSDCMTIDPTYSTWEFVRPSA